LLLEKIASWMNPGAKLFVHIFTHHRYAYPFTVKDSSDWMAAYFFTGGLMPSDDLLLYFQKHVSCAKHWLMSGVHYQRTAKAWLEKCDQNRTAILSEFTNGYGDQALARLVRWRVFFMAVEELWGWKDGREWTVSHYLFEPKR
jgi:cyclopropane-fatty-acyl-phospholipid synthase